MAKNNWLLFGQVGVAIMAGWGIMYAFFWVLVKLF